MELRGLDFTSFIELVDINVGQEDITSNRRDQMRVTWFYFNALKKY